MFSAHWADRVSRRLAPSMLIQDDAAVETTDSARNTMSEADRPARRNAALSALCWCPGGIEGVLNNQSVIIYLCFQGSGCEDMCHCKADCSLESTHHNSTHHSGFLWRATACSRWQLHCVVPI